MTRRGDPLGIFSRDVAWTDGPRGAGPPAAAADGARWAPACCATSRACSTDAVSQSDLAFHALREYVPGDDLRHVHWRSSAKVMGSAGETELLVRQYLDTRRSHATIVVDDDPMAWADPDDFETAMSVAASLAVRAILDDFEISFMCGDQAATGNDGHLALDAVCRADFGRAGLVDLGAPGTGRRRRHQPALPGHRCPGRLRPASREPRRRSRRRSAGSR